MFTALAGIVEYHDYDRMSSHFHAESCKELAARIVRSHKQYVRDEYYATGRTDFVLAFSFKPPYDASVWNGKIGTSAGLNEDEKLDFLGGVRDNLGGGLK